MSLYDERRRENRGNNEIKVTDRRRFTADGEVRPDAPPLEARAAAAPQRAEQAAPPPPPPATQNAPVTPQPSTDAASDEPTSPVDFLSFVASLATQAMAALGMLPEHESPGMPRSPEMAREYIDIIAMLEQRTRGNVTPQEAQALKRLLSDLRLGYVEATRSVKTAHMPPEMMGALRQG